VVRLLLLILWAAWLWPFVFRAPHGQKRSHITVVGPTRIGLLLETAAVTLVSVFRVQQPPTAWRIAGGVALAFLAIVMAWTSVRYLGRQFRIHAGLYHDHELVRTGPYAIVRHPIYAALLLMLLANALILSTWQMTAIAVAIYIVGTEIRVRTEDRLLASRFGEAFEQYRQSVPAYIPLLR